MSEINSNLPNTNPAYLNRNNLGNGASIGALPNPDDPVPANVTDLFAISGPAAFGSQAQPTTPLGLAAVNASNPDGGTFAAQGSSTEQLLLDFVNGYAASPAAGLPAQVETQSHANGTNENQVYAALYDLASTGVDTSAENVSIINMAISSFRSDDSASGASLSDEETSTILKMIEAVKQDSNVDMSVLAGIAGSSAS
jgi:hypothetical protein